MLFLFILISECVPASKLQEHTRIGLFPGSHIFLSDRSTSLLVKPDPLDPHSTVPRQNPT